MSRPILIMIVSLNFSNLSKFNLDTSNESYNLNMTIEQLFISLVIYEFTDLNNISSMYHKSYLNVSYSFKRI